MKRLLVIVGIGVGLLWFGGPIHKGLEGLFQRHLSPEPARQGAAPRFPPPAAEVQRALQEAGFDPGPIDGRMGRRTRNALKAFQSAKNLKPSGEVTRQTWQALQAVEKKLVTAVAIPESTRLALLPPSENKEGARAAIMEYRLHAPDRVKKAQLALKQAGFDPGPIDGELGPRTEQALRAFQRAHGLDPDGIVGVKTWTALRAYLTLAEGPNQRTGVFADGD